MIKIQSTLGKKGIYMSKFRTHIGVILAMVLAISPVAIYSATAATGGPRDAVITLQSPFLDATNTSDARVNQQMADGWVAKGWFGTGLLVQVAFAPVGSTINLTYNVKDKNGKPLAFTKVNLRINKGYSEAASIVSVDGVKTKGIDRPPFDQANVIHRTDAYGNVTFAVKNLDLESLGETEPESMTSNPIFSDDKLDRLHSQMLPEVNSEQADHSAITEFHYYIPKAPIVVAATKPTITLVTNNSSAFCKSKGEIGSSTTSIPSIFRAMVKICLRMIPFKQPSEIGGVITTLPVFMKILLCNASTTFFSSFKTKQLS